MNRVIIMGRLTKDPNVRETQTGMTVARYTLAVDRRGRKEGDQGADFIPVVAFDKAGQFAEKYFRQGMRVLVEGRIQTGSYKDREGRTIYTTDVIADGQEFADSKREAAAAAPAPAPEPEGGWITDPVNDPGLPFA